MKPIILFEGSYTKKSLESFKKENKIWAIFDIYEQQLVELFEVKYPHLKNASQFAEEQKNFIKKSCGKDASLKGDWIYLPWNGTFIHMLKEKDYYSLRTNRNKNLITLQEQEILKDFTVGIVGLSVGSSIATGLAYQGISSSMKLAEFDSLETTNLNRIRASIYHIGLPKLEIAARQIYEINPYEKLILNTNGLTEKNLEEFVLGQPKPKVIFEIIDDFVMKIKLRVAARKAGIPVIMMANLGDSILIDIERFDENKNVQLFNGIIGDLPEKILQNPDIDGNQYAVQIVGLENVPSRALASVREINKTLVGRPQLSNTVTVGSGLAVYITRCIALGESLPSGRYRVAFDNLFDTEHNQTQ